MNERVQAIRQLLSELEAELATDGSASGSNDFLAMELPLVIQEIVDDLQPLLPPYEATFYWFLFRHSICKDGKPHCRVSVNELMTGVVQSPRAKDEQKTVSQDKVRETLRNLESIGAIIKESEPSRKGTLYRVLIPDEIEECRKFRQRRAVTESKPEVVESEIDFYNVRENRIKVYERDAYKCKYCGKQLTRFTVTLDHVMAVAKGGDNSFDNLVTACLGCNSRKNGRPMGDFLAEA